MNDEKAGRGAAMTKDWAANPLPTMLWWVAPIVFAVAVSSLAGRFGVAAWSLALAWMAAGCLLNAARCHRRHCYLSGPVLLAGAVVFGLEALGVFSLGSTGNIALLWCAFGLVLLSWIPERIWGKYVRRT